MTELADAVLDQYPLSLDLLVMGLVAATRDMSTNSVKVAPKLQTRLDMIINTIISSGSGTSASSPFYVASDADTQVFMKEIIGVTRVVDSSKVGTGDVVAYMVTIPGSDREHILYFNQALQNRYNATNKK